MLKTLFLFIFLSSIILLVPFCAADQESEDVFATVVVLPAFSISVDNNFLDFGLVNPGQSVTLKPETYFNALSFVSNKARKYYIKVQILGDLIGPKGIRIPYSSVKWKVFRASGSGVAEEGWREFSSQPVIVYTSSGEDALGVENKIYFQYRLDLPPEALSGNYSLQVAYLLSEEK